MGWFWTPQRDFDTTRGILDTVVGYSGSYQPNPETSFPTYQNVQDFAETIRITYDPSELSYRDLMEMFLGFHSPMSRNIVGSQYRSAVFVHTEEQREIALQVLREKGAAVSRLVDVEDASAFYQAEEYHQKYLEKAMMY